jgi:type II secretion system protein D
MMKKILKSHSYFTGILALSLCLALQAKAQMRPGGAGGGFGGFGGAGGSSAGRTGTSATSTPRQYPNSGTIGDAYFSIDPETRRVVYIADAETAKSIAQVLTNLDRPKPQVLIKVVFVEVTHNNASDIGIEGGYGKQNMGGTISGANAANVFGLGSLASAVGTNNPALMNNALGQPASSFQSTASSVAGGNSGLYQILGQDYQVTLRAIAQAGNAKILSRPSILARNNQPATITVGQSVPLVTSVSYNGLNGTPINAISYKDVGVILKVTPFITADGLVEMMVSPQISSIDPTLSIPISAGVNAPVIDVRSADTVAVTADGQTVIIGGLMEDSKTRTDTKIPLLGDIPLLGNLFKRAQKNDTKTELLIFLTPHIVQNPTELAALSARERAKSDALNTFKEQDLNKFLDALPTKDTAPRVPQRSGKVNPAVPDARFDDSLLNQGARQPAKDTSDPVRDQK